MINIIYTLAKTRNPYVLSKLVIYDRNLNRTIILNITLENLVVARVYLMSNFKSTYMS